MNSEFYLVALSYAVAMRLNHAHLPNFCKLAWVYGTNLDMLCLKLTQDGHWICPMQIIIYPK